MPLRLASLPATTVHGRHEYVAGDDSIGSILAATIHKRKQAALLLFLRCVCYYSNSSCACATGRTNLNTNPCQAVPDALFGLHIDGQLGTSHRVGSDATLLKHSQAGKQKKANTHQAGIGKLPGKPPRAVSGAR